MWQNLLTWDEHLLKSLNSIVGASPVLDWFLRVIAIYLIYAVPLVLLGWWFWSNYTKKAALETFTAIVVSWLGLTRFIPRFIWYRPRPYVADIGIHELIFRRPDYSFPSDHATALAALFVSAMLLGYRKLGWWLLALMILVGVGRVCIGVHYPLDILSGWAIGAVGSFVVHWLRGPLSKWLYDPVIKLMRKVRLA